MLFDNEDTYFQVAMPYDHRREVVWIEIIKVLQKYIPYNSSVLELGAGHCHFINNVKCKEKYVIDKDPIPKRYAQNDVFVFIGSCVCLDIIFDREFDIIFLSNLLEHLNRDEIHHLLKNIRKRLKKDGRLIIMQPNYRYAYREYFDDFTHITPMDHISVKRLLISCGFKIINMQPKFLPYSMDSRFPTIKWLVYLYLRSPFKPFAKQMLCVAKRSDA